jgi:hypothetical protein
MRSIAQLEAMHPALSGFGEISSKKKARLAPPGLHIALASSATALSKGIS